MPSNEAIEYAKEHSSNIETEYSIISNSKSLIDAFDAGRNSIKEVWIVMESEYLGPSDRWSDRPEAVYFSEEEANKHCPEDCPGYQYYVTCVSVGDNF